MQTSLKYLSLVLSLNLLASCNGEGFKLNCDDDEIAYQKAAKNKDIKTMEQLERRGVYRDAHCEEHVNTPLMKAVTSRSYHTVKWLIKKGADVDIQDWYGYTALHHAVSTYQLEISKLLLENDANPNLQRNGGFTALMDAVYSRNLKIVSLLVEYKADLNIQDDEGKTALMLGVRDNREKIVKFLLDIGADPTIPNKYGETPLKVAERLYHNSIAKLIRSKLKEIKDKGFPDKEIDINAQDENDDTSLIKAARHGRITLVERFIDRRANLNLKNSQGQTALMVAIEEGHEAIALALIAEKVRGRINLNLKDNRGWSALKYARKGKHKAIEEELLRNGAEEYLLSKQIKKGAKSLLFKAAEKAPEAGAAALL